MVPALQIARIDKPHGIFLCLWPALWAFALCKNFALLHLFVIGAISARSAGCILNDIIDRNIDKCIERTRNRPLACGTISLQQAVIVMLLYSAVAFLVAIQLPFKALMICLLTVCGIVIYPFLKRIFVLPQIGLGLVFNMGIFIAWFSVQESLNNKVVILYIVAVLWTFWYDTIYAMQDMRDDKKYNIYSAAISLEKYLYVILRIIPIIIGYILYASCLISTDYIIAFVWYLLYNVSVLNIEHPQNIAHIVFKQQVISGLVIFLGLLF